MRVDRWFTLENMSSAAELPRAYHGTVVLGTKIYMFGGYDGRYTYHTLDVLDIAAKKPRWKRLSCMSQIRCYVAGCSVNGEVWAIGGSENSRKLRSVERLSTHVLIIRYTAI